MLATCGVCGKSEDVPVSSDQLARWKSGELIQRVMPELSSAQRELLISGICGTCFDVMFKDEDDQD